MTFVCVKNLLKCFYDKNRGEVRAVNNISFECDKGVFGLLGPNGAGKTTTLRMLATILKPTSGSILINNCDTLVNSDLVRRSTGFFSSDTGVYDRLTPREMIQYFGELYGMKKNDAQKRTEELIEFFDMKSFADVLCYKLSTGMKKKVSIARAIVHNPPLLILDEPTSGLDIMVAKVVRDFILEEKAKGKCIIMSSHNMNEAEKLCDYVFLIYRGELIARGTIPELKQATNATDLEEAFFKAVAEKNKINW